MRLSKILQNITTLQYLDCDVQNMHTDSRLLAKNDLFIAIKGHNIDARDFIPKALQNQVCAILAESDENDYIQIVDNIQIIYLQDLSLKVSKIAANYYDNPSADTPVVGITGTNGKTTISQLVAQWASLLNKKAATLGTIGNGFYNNLKKAENTTGGPLQIQQMLSEFNKQNADLVVMEVSSHGLVQNRVSSVDFAVTAFTNLTQDHLDYHKTMENYFDAKQLLFTQFNPNYQVINIDDNYGQILIDNIIDQSNIIAVSCKNSNLANKFKNYIYVTKAQFNNNGINISIKSNFTQNKEVSFNTKLIGPFNVSNILIAMAIMLGLNYDINNLLKTIEQLSPVIGRMEVFSAENKPTIIVDYAHTPDALEKALQACKIHTKNKLWCIFGCGGDRDKGKRPLMGKIASDLADEVIITDDNPRTENNQAIIKDITANIENANIINDRFSAIEYAINNADKTDIILVAGKGHEDYQIIGDKTIDYSDRESAKKILNIT